MTELRKLPSATTKRCTVIELIKWVGHYTGLAWLTPFAGTTDNADLHHLQGSIQRDLSWIRSMPPDERLKAVSERLEGLLRAASQPWHVTRGWTDYGAIRVELLASLPKEAQAAALAELRNMEVLVLSGSREKWTALAEDVKKAVQGTDADTQKMVPHQLQGLWREVDFGRARRARGNAKHVTVARLTWTLVGAITVAVAVTLSQYDDQQPRPWLVAVLGLLGGSVSALRSVNMAALPERRSLEVEAITLRLRPVVGAMAALMLYVIERSGIVFQITGDARDSVTAAIQIHIPGDGVRWAYCALAFVAGFSERLFVGMLDRIEQKIGGSTSGSNAKGAQTPPKDGKQAASVSAPAKDAG